METPEYASLEDYPGYKFFREGYVITASNRKVYGSVGKDEKYKTTCFINKDGLQVKVRVHRILMEAFNGPANGREVNHKDNDKLNNHLENLEYIEVADHRRLTHQENKGHNKKSAVKRGKAVIGTSPNGEEKRFETVAEANRYLQSDPTSGYIGTIAKSGGTFKGWTFRFEDNTLEGEEWKDVTNYPGLDTKIQVSNMGRIKTKRVTTYGNLREGYFNYSIQINGKKVEKKVHEFVCWAFNGEKPEWATSVNHKDRNRQNNKPENLEWSDARLQALHKKMTAINI